MSHELIAFTDVNNDTITPEVTEYVSFVNSNISDISTEIVNSNDSRYTKFIMKQGRFPCFLVLKNNSRKAVLYGKVTEEELLDWVVRTIG